MYKPFTVVGVRHGGEKRHVALFAGLPMSELASALHAVFPATRGTTILGVTQPDGSGVSLQQLCAAPDRVIKFPTVDLVLDYAPQPRQQQRASSSSRSAPAPKQRATAVTEVASEDQFLQELTDADDKLVVAEFYATWCGACQHLAPEFDRLSQALTEVQFLKIDADRLKSLASEMSVSIVPTFQFFFLGHKIGELVGPTRTELEEMIQYAAAMDVNGNDEADADTDAAAIKRPAEVANGGRGDVDDSSDDNAPPYTDPSQELQDDDDDDDLDVGNQVDLYGHDEQVDIGPDRADQLRTSGATTVTNNSYGNSTNSSSRGTNARSSTQSSSQSAVTVRGGGDQASRRKRTAILLDVIARLAKPPHPFFTERQAEQLEDLVLVEDVRLIDAYEQYIRSEELRGLISAFFDAIGATPPPAVAAATASVAARHAAAAAATQQPRPQQTRQSLSASSSSASSRSAQTQTKTTAASGGGPGIRPLVDQELSNPRIEIIRLIERLVSESLLSSGDGALLVSLAEADADGGDQLARDQPQLLAALVAYEVDRSTEEFVDTLRRLALRVARRQHPPVLARARSSSDNDGNRALVVYRRLQKLMNLCTRGLLTVDQAYTLKDLIEQEQHMVAAAFVAFDYDEDEEELVDTLSQILRKKQDAENEDDEGYQQARADNGNDKDNDNADDEEEPEDDDEADADAPLQYSDGAVDGDEDTDYKDDEEEAAHWRNAKERSRSRMDLARPESRIGFRNGGGVGVSSSSNRTDSARRSGTNTNDDSGYDDEQRDKLEVLAVVRQLAEEDVFDPDDVIRLLNIIAEEQDHTVLAAIDAYLAGGSWEELVDTLLRLLRLRKASDQARNLRQLQLPQQRGRARASSNIDYEQEYDDDKDSDAEAAARAVARARGESVDSTDKEVAAVTGGRLGGVSSRRGITNSRQQPRASSSSSTSSSSQSLSSSRDGPGRSSGRQSVSALERLVAVLLMERSISNGEADFLNRMVLDKDAVVWAAYDLYDEDEDWDEFKDTVIRFVNRRDIDEEWVFVDRPRGSSGRGRSTSRTSRPSASDSATSTELEYVSPYAKDGPAAIAAEQIQFLGQLKTANRVTLSEYDHLVALACAGDDVLSAAFEVYREVEAADDFLDTLQRICRSHGVPDSQPTQPEQQSPINLDDYTDIFSKVVVDLRNSHKINEEEVYTLRHLFAEGDSVIVAAFEVFQLEQDELNLRDTITVIAKSTTVGSSYFEDEQDEDDNQPPQQTADGDNDYDDAAKQGYRGRGFSAGDRSTRTSTSSQPGPARYGTVGGGRGGVDGDSYRFGFGDQTYENPDDLYNDDE